MYTPGDLVRIRRPPLRGRLGSVVSVEGKRVSVRVGQSIEIRCRLDEVELFKNRGNEAARTA